MKGYDKKRKRILAWLFFAGAIFGLFDIPVSIQGNFEVPHNIINFLFVIGMLIFPAGIAILRYRLFNIEIIIRRTLQYTVLVGLLR